MFYDLLGIILTLFSNFLKAKMFLGIRKMFLIENETKNKVLSSELTEISLESGNDMNWQES